MSMHRQIWLAIVISAFVVFGGGLASSIVNAKVYLESQLTQKNIDNANALALTLTHSTPNQASADAAVNAMFDTGHYEFIEIKDKQNKAITERYSNGENTQYAYLQKIIHIHPRMGVAEINNGWKQYGTVYLSSNVSFAYETLHRTIVHSALLMLLAGVLSGLLSYLILNRITKPLNDVIKQASAISNKNFMIIPETKVPELNKLAKAMNNTAHRLRDAFNHEEQKLEAMRKKACTDPLTGLANRSFFLSVVESTLNNDDLNGGSLLLLRISKLAELNEELGRSRCDELIKAVANTLNSYTVGFDEAIAGRLNGSDFAVIIPNLIGKNNVINKAVLENIRQVAGRWTDPKKHIYIGMTEFKQKTQMSKVLAAADAALIDAESKD
jgi:diguanylate cyclase (GGDEF)-like protein